MPEINSAMLFWALGVLFSMAYPVILTLIFALCGLIMVRKQGPAIRITALVIAPALTLALAALLGFLTTTTIPPRPANALRIAHLNTFIPDHDYTAKRAFVQNSNADIISMQELHTDLSTILMAESPLPYHILSTAITKPYHLPMLLLSRWPITHVQSFGPRLELYAIAHPQTPFYVLQIHPHAPHTPSIRAARNQQWETLTSATLPHPLIVVGDFNTTPWDPILTRLHQTLTTANHLPTWPTTAPLTPIDNILTSADIPTPTITRIHVAHSDHLGLIADFPTLPQ